MVLAYTVEEFAGEVDVVFVDAGEQWGYDAEVVDVVDAVDVPGLGSELNGGAGFVEALAQALEAGMVVADANGGGGLKLAFEDAVDNAQRFFEAFEAGGEVGVAGA